MEIERVFHMTGGEGETSYAKNSLLPRTVISLVKPILEESITKLCYATIPEQLIFADLGCSAGPNTLLVVSEIIDILERRCQGLGCSAPSLQVFLNDLYGNDFNTVFKSLPEFYKRLKEEKGNSSGPCFIAAVPGSFYKRLFPNNSLHFFHCSYCLMWLSQIPRLVTEEGEELNKGNICITKTSPRAVFDAYHEQFKKDFREFLRCRSEELFPGGHMVLTTLGSIKSNDPHIIFEVLGVKLKDMVQEGLTEEAKLDSFNMPFYMPTEEEVREVIEEEGSFSLQKLETIKMDWDAYIKKADDELDKNARAAILATDIRAVSEPILATHFDKEVIDDLFRRFKEVALDFMVEEKCQHINLVISLTKKGSS